MILKSFKDARKAFSTNLTTILSALGYTPASLSMKLNAEATSSGSVRSVVSASEVADWMSGKKIPSLYAAFKLASFLRVSIDLLLDPELDAMKIIAHSFAFQSSETPKVSFKKEIHNTKPVGIPMTEIVELLRPISEAEIQLVCDRAGEVLGDNNGKTTLLDSLANNDFLNAATTTEISRNTVISATQPVVTPVVPVKSTIDLAKISVEKHTTSKKYNVKLAYAILNSKYSVKEMAMICNIATSTLRGYMYYDVPVPKNVAYLILKAIKACNYASLGLKYDETKVKYIHQTV